MFQKQNKKNEDLTSFAIGEDLKVSLTSNEPPYSSLLTILRANSTMYEVCVSFESAETLKEIMIQPACTQDSLITLLEKLNLNNFANELSKEIKRGSEFRI